MYGVFNSAQCSPNINAYKVDVAVYRYIYGDQHKFLQM